MPEQAESACSVELYGDSIMHGGYDIVKRLSEPPAATLSHLRPAYVVRDHSVNGDSLTMRRRTFSHESRTGHIVVIQAGINDAGLGLPIEAPLRFMVGVAQAEGRTVILTGLTRQELPVARRDDYDAIIRKIAIETHSIFADWGSVEFSEGDLADDIHPAKACSDRLVVRLVEVLDKIAPQCSDAKSLDASASGGQAWQASAPQRSVG